MKRLLIVLLMLLFTSPVFADRVVSDPSTSLIGMEYEIWQGTKGQTDLQVVATGKLIVTKPYEADGSVNYNLDSLPTGTFAWYFRTFAKAYVYGPSNTPGGSSVYSVFVPFDFTKRNIAAGSITGLRLAP